MNAAQPETKENPAKSSVEVELFDRLTLKDLREIAKEHTVFFTPHVGNKSREDLILMEQTGVRTANFERNASVLDDIDQPEFLRVEGQNYPLAHQEALTKSILTPHLNFGTDLHDRPSQIVDRVGAKTPAHLHHKATRMALPHAHLETASESLILGPENEMIRDVMDNLHRRLHSQNGHAPLQIFSRYVARDGVVYYLDQNGGKEIKDKSGTDMPQLDRHDIGDLANLANDFFGFSQKITDIVNNGESEGNLHGPMPRNEFMVLLLGLKPLFDDMRTGKLKPEQFEEYTAYAVSGPSMIKYSTSKDFKRTLDYLYQQVKDIVATRFKTKLPDRLKIRMIPGANLSYLPFEGETQAIDAITEMVKANAEYTATQGQLAAVQGTKPKELIAQVNEKKTKQAGTVANVVAAVRGAPNLSQYDLLEGRRMMDTSVIEGLSFKLHAIIIDQLRKKS